jgi:hypothetical protein
MKENPAAHPRRSSFSIQLDFHFNFMSVFANIPSLTPEDSACCQSRIVREFVP